MPTEVKMPQLGESTYEATIGKWLKKPGDQIQRFEPLVELITDKVNVEMPSPVGGKLLEIVAEEGQTLPTGAVIALVETAEPAQAPTAAAGTDGEEPQARQEVSAVGKAAEAAPRRAGGLRLSPLVSRLADEHGIHPEELARIEGTGAGGRITKNDVLRYLERRGAAAAPAAPPKPPEVRAASGDRVIPLDAVRRAIADRMARAKREIPHAYGVVEADVTELTRWYEANRDAFLAHNGVRLTYTALFVRAVVEGLKAFPIVNAQWSEQGIVQKGAMNIGVAVSFEDALVVPVIHHAEEKSLVGVARELDAIVRRTREGKLALDDVQGGTFTITNPGVFGSILSMPIINYPQAAILATDAIVKRPVVRDDAIAIRAIMHLGLSFDHRVFDGAVAVGFLNKVKECLEAVDPVTR
ncbi:MAG: dihydrolipoamide acetyltransferase family protein [Armatimonadota bacterium]|nr:dihydrolipoamide acetyltransferase family protein [Armatimonadota bacterium]MDR5696439.1 dihydrolipoamide acetyltransferase family protein [Armatimonadota bacterium]